MAILERYRRSGTTPNSGYRRALVLAGMLAVVIALTHVLSRTASRQKQPDSAPNRVAPGFQIGPTSCMPESTRTAEWRPLSPEQERALLAQLTDQQPLYVREHREAYYYLLGKVHQMTEEELEACVDRTIRYEDFGRQPEIIRGATVEVFGRLLRLEETPLEPGVAPLPAVYEGQVLDRYNRVYSIILTERPQPPYIPGSVRIGDGLRVRVRGIFMQVLAYENRENPPRVIVSPLIIGRQLQPVPPLDVAPPTVSWRWAMLATLAVAGAAAVIICRTRPWSRRRRAEKHSVPPQMDMLDLAEIAKSLPERYEDEQEGKST